MQPQQTKQEGISKHKHPFPGEHEKAISDRSCSGRGSTNVFRERKHQGCHGAGRLFKAVMLATETSCSSSLSCSQHRAA